MSEDRCSHRRFRPRPARVAAGLACLGAALVALPAAADIFKCIDSGGNVTYQNEKCPTGAKSGKVEIFDNNWTADRTEKEAEWQRNANNHRVVTGMPAKWVRESLGEPGEIRETTVGGATELWLYNLPDRAVQVGMRDNEVLWSRETPPAARAARNTAAAPKSPPAGAAQLAEAPRAAGLPGRTVSDLPRDPEAPRAEPPRAVTEPPRTVSDLPRMAGASTAAEGPRGAVRGRNCRDVLTELGKPDSQREIPATDVGETDAVTEYVYEAGSGGGNVRTRILCANGKVEGVDRSSTR
jgi:hypothetical protein